MKGIYKITLIILAGIGAVMKICLMIRKGVCLCKYLDGWGKNENIWQMCLRPSEICV